jgi:hypothetical protein
MSSRAFLNSFMLCPRLRAKSGNFFAPKRTRTMRRMINKSGPPRFPIPNASIFITIFNWLVPCFYSPKRRIFFWNAIDGILRYLPMPRTGEDPHLRLVRSRRCSAPWLCGSLGFDAMSRFAPLQIPGKGRARILFVAGVKTAAFPDLQKLSGLPHSRRFLGKADRRQGVGQLQPFGLYNAYECSSQ